jgi:hypothetical protein
MPEGGSHAMSRGENSSDYLGAAMNVAGASNNRASNGGVMSNIFTSLRKWNTRADAVDIALLGGDVAFPLAYPERRPLVAASGLDL